MTNYDKIQKASPDHLIDILCSINSDPCNGCALNCDAHLRNRLESYLKRDYDCNTSHSTLSPCDIVDRLKTLRLKYFDALNSMGELIPTDILEMYQALDYAISLIENLNLEI